MRKYFDKLGTKEEFHIVSAVFISKIPRTIFIESYNIIEVKKAITGFLSIN